MSLITCLLISLTHLLWGHSALPEESWSGREAQSLMNLWLPHYSLWCFSSLYPIFVCMWNLLPFYPLVNPCMFYTIITSMLNPLICTLRKGERKKWHEKAMSHTKIMRHQGSIWPTFNEELLFPGKPCVII